MSAQTNQSHLSALLRRTLDKKRDDLAKVTTTQASLNKESSGLKVQEASKKLISDTLKLQLLDQALAEVELNKNLSAPPAQPELQSKIEESNPRLPSQEVSPISSSRKEAEAPSRNMIEQGASIQVVETERSPELSPEVEKYLQEVHQEKDRAPKEIVIDDDMANLPSNNQFVSEPVIVVPITPEIEKKGKRKSPKFSIRWLVEWSQKIIKMFSGKVVYLQPPSEN